MQAALEKPLKVSVLASGTVLVDGKPATWDEIETAFQETKARNAAVWYYREGPATEPLGEAASVIGNVLKLIIGHRLPVRLSTRPDFSDCVDEQGRSHLQDSSAQIDAAVTSELSNVERIFASARQEACRRQLMIVRRDATVLALPAPPPGSVPPERAKAVEALVPSTGQRNIAVIASTDFTIGKAGAPDLAEAGKAIPFLGMLIGLSYIGHAVYIFDAIESVLPAGCRDADLLLVDSAVLPHLPRGWEKTAVERMRNPNILVHNRQTYQLLVIHTAGGVTNRIEFPKAN